ncbi:MAG: c-type cytochrome [Woeseiaceae bacterium]
MKRHRASRRAAASAAALAACIGLAASSFALGAGDSERGAMAFRSCIACHTLEPGRHLTGPSLAGVWGTKAASKETFRRYSEALRKSNVVWDERTLDAWLQAPQKLVPGNTMQFPGVADDAVRADLVAFLKAASEGKLASVPKPPALPDLKKASPVSTIASIRRCGDSYFVTNGRGQTAAYWEFNLRFKTDSSPSGPAPGKPVMVGQGMQGDRAQVLFSAPEEISRFIKEKC